MKDTIRVLLNENPPDEITLVVDGTNYRDIYCVGDLHGQYRKLMAQLDAVGFDQQQDLLVATGDLIDRGYENESVLGLVGKPWFLSVQGNHDQFGWLVQDDPELQFLWFHNGGAWILKTDLGDERERILKQLYELKQLPYIIEVRTNVDTVVVVSHACYPHPEYRNGQSIDYLDTVWDRNRYHARRAGDLNPTAGADTFVHGHNHVLGMEVYGNHFYIATGVREPKEPFTLFKIQ